MKEQPAPTRVKNAVRMRVFPASGAYLPLKLYAMWRLQRLTNSNQDETKRILGVSRQTSGWDYFTGRLQG